MWSSTTSTITYFFIGFGGWFLALSQIIPISILVHYEMSISMISSNMTMDVNLYSSFNQIPLKVNSVNLSEELGQVSCIFSDKTGTLTKNEMKFKSLFILNKEYGSINNTKDKNPVYHYLNKVVDFYDEYIYEDIENNVNNIQNMLKMMSICHSTLVDNDKRFN